MTHRRTPVIRSVPLGIDIPKNPDAGPKVTVSFRVSKRLLAEFDALAKAKGYDRTGLLLVLVKQAIEPDKD